MNELASRASFIRPKRRARSGPLWLAVMWLAVILIIASVRVIAQDEAERRSDVITGQVMDSGGQPINRAMVYARRLGSAPSASARSAMTDASGGFKIAKLPPGIYSLWCTSPGYVNNFSNSAGRPGKPSYYHPGDAATLTLIKGGIISGRVTDGDGDSIVNASVRLLRVRDAEGRPASGTGGYNAWMFATDDRGMYRIYGVEPGVYVLSVGGSGQDMYGRNNLYDEDAPTFHPSATRDAAAEVPVREGQETGGIDIRHRGERGRAVRGVVTGAISGGTDWEAVSITLKHAANGTDEAFTYVGAGQGEKSLPFELTGVPDGEYEIVASRGGWRASDVVNSAPLRISVKGADIKGIALNLVPLASIGGRVIFEPLPARAPESRPETERGAPTDCRPGRPPSFAEVALAARHSEARTPAQRNLSSQRGGSDDAPNERGDFVLRNLDAGRYRLTSVAPNENWYVRAITSAAMDKGAAGGQSGSSGELIVRAGESIRDVTMTMVEGAASVRGKVNSADEGRALPARLMIYAVPANRPDDVIRYAEAGVEADGSFSLNNLAPGQYWLLARPLRKAEMGEMALPVVWDAATRAALYRVAQASNNLVELKTCQKLADVAVSYRRAKP